MRSAWRFWMRAKDHDSLQAGQMGTASWGPAGGAVSMVRERKPGAAERQMKQGFMGIKL
jgi:hypothetical protein